MNNIRERIVIVARSYVGRIQYKGYRERSKQQNPYEGLRCDNFIRFVAEECGLYIPDDIGCWEMYGQLPDTQMPLPADLVFRNGRRDGRPGHVGIYTGESVVHLPKSPGVVVESGLDELKPILGFRSIGPYIEARQ